MRIHDLGRLEVESTPGGSPTIIVGAKQVAVLSVLCAARDERVSLDALRLAGWSDDAVVADATIENHVWRLRKALEPGIPAQESVVANDQGGYRLDLPPEAVDSGMFESLAEQARDAARRARYRSSLELCDRALGLWRGQPYGHALRSPLVAVAVDRLVELNAQVEERRVDALLALGEAEQAVVDSARLTGLHPFREHVWAQRMTAFARLGRSEEALSAFRTVRSLLREELGLDPGRELQDLQRAIIAQDGPESPVGEPATAVVRPPHLASFQPWPLVGRSAETQRAAHAFEAGRTIVIEGAGGVGRTRVLDETARIARSGGADVLRFVGTRSAASVPLGVFADLVPLTARSDDPLTLMRRCGEELRERASRGQLLICVDDAQLLDDPSAALVLHLATAEGIPFALTLRSREQMPDALAVLCRAENTELVSLGPLGEAETGTLFESVLGGPVDPLLHRWAFRTTRGNSFHLVELARAMQREQSALRIDGRWMTDGVPQLPSSLAELVQTTLEQLDAPFRRAVERLALAEPMRLGTMGEDGELMVELEQKGMVVVETTAHDARVALAHPLFAAVLRQLLPPLRAHRIRLELIARYRSQPSLTPDERLRLSQWLMEVGDVADSGEVISAARLALASNDPGLALRLLDHLENDRHEDEVPSVDVDARLLRSRAHVLRREHDQAAEALQSLEPALRTPDQGVAYVETQLEVTRFGRSMVDDLPALFERAVRWWPEDEDWTRRIERLRLRDAVFEGQAGVPAIDEALDVSDSARLGSLYYAGHTAQARALYREAERDPPFLTLDEATLAAIGARVELDRADDLPALEARLVRMRTVGYDLDDPAAIGIAVSKIADLRMLQDAPGDAMHLYAEAARQWERRDPIALRASAWAGMVTAAALLGDEEESTSALSRMREIAGETPRPHLISYVARAEAMHAVGRGDAAAAAGLLDAAERALAVSPVHVARLLYERVLLGLSVDEHTVTALRARAGVSDSPLMVLYADHAEAMAVKSVAALRDVAGRFRELGVLAFARRAEEDAGRYS